MKQQQPHKKSWHYDRLMEGYPCEGCFMRKVCKAECHRFVVWTNEKTRGKK